MKFLFKILIILMVVSCGKTPTPKARAFFRIAFLEKNYHKVEVNGLYAFEIPQYASLKSRENARNLEAKDLYPFELSASDTIKYKKEYRKLWENVLFPQQNGQLHLTYFPVKSKKDLAEYVEDTHKFVYKHTIKADGIRAKEYAAPQRNVYGTLYDIEGNTASAVQFFVTDSTRHFLRGSLYLNERPNKDSLNVVVDFLRKDVIRLMQTLEWK